MQCKNLNTKFFSAPFHPSDYIIILTLGRRRLLQSWPTVKSLNSGKADTGNQKPGRSVSWAALAATSQEEGLTILELRFLSLTYPTQLMMKAGVFCYNIYPKTHVSPTCLRLQLKLDNSDVFVCCLNLQTRQVINGNNIIEGFERISVDDFSWKKALVTFAYLVLERADYSSQLFINIAKKM